MVEISDFYFFFPNMKEAGKGYIPETIS